MRRIIISLYDKLLNVNGPS